MPLAESLRTLVRSINFSVLGVAATITVEGKDPVTDEHLVIWLRPIAQDLPGPVPFQREEPRRMIAVRRDLVPELPRGTRVVVAEPTQGVTNWVVDEMDSVQPDHYRVAILPGTEGS